MKKLNPISVWSCAPVLMKLILSALFILASTNASAAVYKYVTKEGKTVITGEKLKGKGNKLIKVYRMKNSNYKSGKKKTGKRVKTRKRSGKGNGMIFSCSDRKHLSEKARIYKKPIQIYSKIYGVDEELIFAIVRQESCFNETAHSHVGAIGLMQLMPKTAQGLRINNPWNPEHNIQGGIKYIAQMLKFFKGKPKLAIAAYNAGPGNVKKYRGIPPFKETRNYVKKVYAEYMRLKRNGVSYGVHPEKIQLALK